MAKADHRMCKLAEKALYDQVQGPPFTDKATMTQRHESPKTVI